MSKPVESLRETANMTRIVVMITTSLAELKAKLSAFIDEVERSDERVVITKNGKPVAVLMSLYELEGLEETIDILSDPVAVREINEGIADVRAGRTVPMSDVWPRT